MTLASVALLVIGTSAVALSSPDYALLGTDPTFLKQPAVVVRNITTELDKDIERVDSSPGNHDQQHQVFAKRWAALFRFIDSERDPHFRYIDGTQ